MENLIHHVSYRDVVFRFALDPPHSMRSGSSSASTKPSPKRMVYGYCKGEHLDDVTHTMLHLLQSANVQMVQEVAQLVKCDDEEGEVSPFNAKYDGTECVSSDDGQDDQLFVGFNLYNAGFSKEDLVTKSKYFRLSFSPNGASKSDTHANIHAVGASASFASSTASGSAAPAVATGEGQQEDLQFQPSVQPTAASSADIMLTSLDQVPDTLYFDAVCFPIFAQALSCWMDNITSRAAGADYLKLYFLTGANRKGGDGVETCSTNSAAQLIMLFTQHYLEEYFGAKIDTINVALENIHSGAGVFVYDENVRFVNMNMLPKLDAARDACLAHYGEEAWAANFHITVTLAEGAPARVAAINQSLFTFKPDYIHILRPKTFLEQEGKLYKKGVQFLAFNRASTMPAISVTNEDSWFTGNPDIDANIRPLVREMIQHRQQLLHTLTENRHEVGDFWLRKTKKPVLAVLLIQKPGERPKLFRGINLEVSMPTGSLCAERNVIGTALAQDPSLRRKHIKMVAVLSVPGLSVNSVLGNVISQPGTPGGSGPSTPVVEPAHCIPVSTAARSPAHGLRTVPTMPTIPSTPPLTNSQAQSPRVGSTIEGEPSAAHSAASAPSMLPPLPLEVGSPGRGGGQSGGSTKRRRLLPSGSFAPAWSRMPLKQTPGLPLGGGIAKDINPLEPCGTCREWLLKIAEANPNFRVITFASVACKEIYVKRVL